MPIVCHKRPLLSLTVDEASRTGPPSPLLTRLSLVVHLSDPWLPAGGTLGAVWVQLAPLAHDGTAQVGLAPIYNLSGIACFLDLRPGSYTLTVEGEHYFPTSQLISVPHPDPTRPVQDVALQPTPSYPFPMGAMRVRAVVWEDGATPVGGATVTVLDRGPQTQTTARGEFALAWPVLSDDQVIPAPRGDVIKRFVRGNGGGKTIRIALTHPAVQTKIIEVLEVEEGTTRTEPPITVAR
jgi:hypothetical protein